MFMVDEKKHITGNKDVDNGGGKNCRSKHVKDGHEEPQDEWTDKCRIM